MPKFLLNLTSGQYSQLQCLSQRYDIPMAVYVRQALDEYLIKKPQLHWVASGMSYDASIGYEH
jgi:hypothetical protein